MADSDSDSSSSSLSIGSPQSPNVQQILSDSELGSPELVEMLSDATSSKPVKLDSPGSSGSESERSFQQVLSPRTPMSPAESEGLILLADSSDEEKSNGGSGAESDEESAIIIGEADDDSNSSKASNALEILSMSSQPSPRSPASIRLDSESPSSSLKSPISVRSPLSVKSPLSENSPLQFQEEPVSPLSPEADDAAGPPSFREESLEIRSKSSRRSSAKSLSRRSSSSIIEVSEDDTPLHTTTLRSPIPAAVSLPPMLQSRPPERLVSDDASSDSDICVPVEEVKEAMRRKALPPPHRQQARKEPPPKKQPQKLYLKKSRAEPPVPEKLSKNTKNKDKQISEQVKAGLDKTMKRITAKTELTIKTWVLSVVTGSEVRVTRNLVPLETRGKGGEERCCEDIVLDEGSTGCVLPAKLTNASYRLVTDSKTLVLINSSGTLSSVYVWVRVAVGAALLRADSLSVLATGDEEIQQGRKKGPVLIGRQQAWLTVSERNTDIKDRPKWVKSKAQAKQQPTSHLKLSFPLGSYVKAEDYGEGKVEVRDGDDVQTVDKIAVSFSGALKLHDPSKLTLVKKKYSLVPIVGPEFTDGQLDAKKTGAAERKQIAKQSKVKEEDEMVNKTKKTLEVEKLDKMVSRLQGYRPEGMQINQHVDKCGRIKCQDKKWTTNERMQKKRDEVRQIEVEKRRANPTYDAMMNWKEEWDKSRE